MSDLPPPDRRADGRPRHDDPYRGGPPSAPSNGMGLAALVVGIVALLLAVLFFPLGILLGIAAVVLGVLGRRKVARREATNGGQATAGLVCGVLAVVVGGLIAAFIGSFILDNTDEIRDLSDCIEEAGGDTEAQDDCRRRFEEGVGVRDASSP